ncbi:MAG: polysaccharide deacetylase family protein [Bacteroidales bacterium]
MSFKIAHSRFLLITLAVLMLSSCRKNIDDTGGKIMLSFDDQYIDSWYAHRQLFKNYDAQVCFYVTRPLELSNEDFKKLLILQNDGHVIGSHGMYHRHINEFETAESYYKQEVLPSVQIFEAHGLDVRAYAYPHGKGRSDVDSLLISHGFTVRDAGWNYSHQVLSKKETCYIHDTGVPKKFVAMGLDHNYKTGYVDIFLGLRKAKRENNMIVLVGHDIDRKYNNYITHPLKLRFLLKQCTRNNIDFYLPVLEKED